MGVEEINYSEQSGALCHDWIGWLRGAEWVRSGQRGAEGEGEGEEGWVEVGGGEDGWVEVGGWWCGMGGRK